METKNNEQNHEIKKHIDEDVKKYVEQMSSHEKKSYYIAQEHLESSFTIEKSVGFQKWKASQKST